jgi:hypothetical protein
MFRVTALATLLCCLLGCAYRLDYQPSATRWQSRSREEAVAAMRTVLFCDRTPQIDDVTITEEFLNYRLHPTTVVLRLFFGKMGDIVWCTVRTRSMSWMRAGAIWPVFSF